MSRKITLGFLKPLGLFAALTLLLAHRAGNATWGREASDLLNGHSALSFAEATPLPSPLYNTEILVYALLGAACLLAAGHLGLVLLRGLGLSLRVLRRGRVVLGESGQAMTEVAVSFPVLLITTLILMQMALMYQARNVVTYAAFSAVRAAIVWIPAESDTEGKHMLNLDGGDKLDKIQQAAAMACVPISPRAGLVLESLPFVGDIIGDAFGAFSSFMATFGLAGQYTDAALQRFAYSTYATQVTIYKATESGFTEQTGLTEWRYPDSDDVGVLVTHKYYLPIPLVNRYIGSEWTIFEAGPFSVNLPGEYSTIRATAFLPLEGETGGPGDSWAAPPIDGFWD
jgi:hypothetical protein